MIAAVMIESGYRFISFLLLHDMNMRSGICRPVARQARDTFSNRRSADRIEQLGDERVLQRRVRED